MRASQIATWRFDESPYPYWLMGDFNDTPDSRTSKLSAEDAAPATKPAEDRFTFSSTDPKIEIGFRFGF